MILQALFTMNCLLLGDGWPFAATLDKAEEFGAEVVEMDVDEVCVDEERKLVTSPAFMSGEAKFHEVFDGVQKMIDEMLKMF